MKPYLGVDRATLSPQVKKRHSSLRAAFSINLCTHSCKHVQCRLRGQVKFVRQITFIVVVLGSVFEQKKTKSHFFFFYEDCHWSHQLGHDSDPLHSLLHTTDHHIG